MHKHRQTDRQRQLSCMHIAPSSHPLGQQKRRTFQVNLRPDETKSCKHQFIPSLHLYSGKEVRELESDYKLTLLILSFLFKSKLIRLRFDFLEINKNNLLSSTSSYFEFSGWESVSLPTFALSFSTHKLCVTVYFFESPSPLLLLVCLSQYFVIPNSSHDPQTTQCRHYRPGPVIPIQKASSYTRLFLLYFLGIESTNHNSIPRTKLNSM